ncbi:rRNA maturation RNase YbeY [Oscillospiraceae bacterium OttesenSCG-928-F05]|nr:rRNA maturation RNase YbeY [Oscillospiraceae bacterium OttesenSCG-928-F05]
MPVKSKSLTRGKALRHRVKIRHMSKKKLPVILRAAVLRGAWSALRTEAPEACGVDIVIMDDRGIQALNAETRGKPEATDVLSFPMNTLSPGRWPAHIERDDEGRALLGDIALSSERAEAQARAYGHSSEREFAFLTVHACLHLLGYDHEGDEAAAAIMRRREAEIMETAGIFRE